MDLLFHRTRVNIVPNSVLLHAMLNRVFPLSLNVQMGCLVRVTPNILYLIVNSIHL